MWSKPKYCGQSQNHVWIANFRGRSGEIIIPSKSSYFFMVLWHGWSCKEVCETTLWVAKTNKTTQLTPQSINSMHRWSPLQRRRNKICWRIVKYMFSNCSQMLMFGKNWTTWYIVVSKQACTFHNKMDQSMWQTSESTYFIHSSHKWTQTILSCGKFCQSNADWDCFRILILREILKIQNPFRWNIMCFWKPHICSNKLDVQETNCRFAQFNRIWNYLTGHWTETGSVACSGTMGSNCFCSWKCFSCFRWIRETCDRCSQTSEVSQQDRCGERHWFGSLKCSIRESWSFIVCGWRQWGCDQDDYERQKSNNETRLQNPQSCSWLVVWSN